MLDVEVLDVEVLDVEVLDVDVPVVVPEVPVVVPVVAPEVPITSATAWASRGAGVPDCTWAVATPEATSRPAASLP